MDPALASIVVAVIGLVGTIGAVSIREFRAMRRENRNDHGTVMGHLTKVSDKLDHVSERLDDHIDWHLKK